MTAAIVALVGLLLLAFLRVPIAVAMGLAGIGGMWAINGSNAALALMAQTFADIGVSSSLALLPLFILMGTLVTRTGMSHELYAAANAFLGHRRGGLAMATIVACGGFSAICGSSLATAATMTKVALPSMRHYGYDDRLASGAVAAGGTLGILIPPSVILVIYGSLTDTSIGKLFFAGLLPGLLGLVLYCAAVWFMTWRRPELGPPAAAKPWKARFLALRGVWGIALLFAIIMGGIYAGMFTPTEASGVGAVVALIFANFMNEAGLPRALSQLVTAAGAEPYLVLLIIVLVYLALGCVFESLSMILLTVPIFFPLVKDLGFDLIWFGILVVVVTEVGLITPPVGLNVYVIKSVMPDIQSGSVIRGVVPFLAADIVRIVIIVAFPGIALLLPSLM